MKTKVYELDKYEKRSIPSVGACIYCSQPFSHDELTDEHIIPFALGHNSLVFKNASCKSCAAIIQPYEQEVLRKQLGNFRLQVDAPSRTKKKNRPKQVIIPFVAVDSRGSITRELGSRAFPLEKAPLVLNLWWLPEARIIRGNTGTDKDRGQPWSYVESRVNEIIRTVSEQTGEANVAMKLGEVNRNHFLRFLAKTAHAYAVAELGMDGFTPFLNDLILNKSDDLSIYVGGTPVDERKVDPAETLLISIGGTEEFVAVYFQCYPLLGSPAYGIVVGKRNDKTEERIEAMKLHYM
tara:strand:+ start:6343 stop:7224 length:882 start_codon:yes stop_codon:yes gene_type:complete